LYDISKDPDQIKNVAEDERYAKIKKKQSEMLTEELEVTGDPRVLGGGEKFDKYPYRAGYKLKEK
jgi:hypothetical protein